MSCQDASSPGLELCPSYQTDLDNLSQLRRKLRAQQRFLGRHSEVIFYMNLKYRNKMLGFIQNQ